jgi:hypothetical protein
MTIDSPKTPTGRVDDEPLAFTTVDEAIDDEEAASSFKELLDWMRYLAQHKEQRGRLLDLLGTATDSLKGLMGLDGDPGHRATYASTAAKATQLPQPRRAQTASATPSSRPGKKLIQHAITRFERVSRELPGAPRDTLLSVVARSDLRTAPPPLLAAPKPRKRPACLVKGIRANTVAVRLPETASVPISLPALLQAVNKRLIDDKLTGRVTEILSGVRRHLTVVFDRVVDDETSKVALREVLRGCKTDEVSSHVLDRTTHSILKFNAVPTVTPDGQEVTAAMAATCLARHPDWKKASPLGPPRFIRPKNAPDAPLATLQIKVKDTQKATVAKKLLETLVSFVGVVRRCLPWTTAPTARQCATCLKWGHTAYVCRAREPRCDQCSGTHLTAYHRHHAASCKDPECTHFGIVCANCSQQHHASSVQCPFFKARSSPSQLQELQKQRVERLRRRQ